MSDGKRVLLVDDDVDLVASVHQSLAKQANGGHYPADRGFVGIGEEYNPHRHTSIHGRTINVLGRTVNVRTGPL